MADNWKVGVVWSFTKKKKRDDDISKECESKLYIGTEKGYSNHDLMFVKKKDGAIFFSESDGDGFIYLYPQQVKHLKQFLGMTKGKK